MLVGEFSLIGFVLLDELKVGGAKEVDVVSLVQPIDEFHSGDGVLLLGESEDVLI